MPFGVGLRNCSTKGRVASLEVTQNQPDMQIFPLPKTNRSPLKMDGWDTIVLSFGSRPHLTVARLYMLVLGRVMFYSWCWIGLPSICARDARISEPKKKGVCNGHTSSFCHVSPWKKHVDLSNYFRRLSMMKRFVPSCKEQPQENTILKLPIFDVVTCTNAAKAIEISEFCLEKNKL